MQRSFAMRIGDHAAIGDGRSVALVARSGEIDWLCWPSFDSPSIFGSILDRERGGGWQIAPAGAATVRRRYLDGSNVLETRFEVPGGAATVTDAMTVVAESARRRRLRPDHELLRVIRGEQGEVALDVTYAPRLDYGRAPVRLADDGRLGLRCQVGSRLLTLRGEAPLAVGGDGVARGRVVVRAGEAVAFSLGFDEGPATLLGLGAAAEVRLAETAAWWRGWLGAMRYEGPYRAEVERSALAIKLLSFAPSGAVVAAATTSLPERLGGDLNWDYRFCWLRDAAFTSRALLELGFHDDAAAFCSWLLYTTRLTRPELRILYDVYGNLPADEVIVPELAGYAGSRPVRLGNAAADQLQLDCYGEVIDAATYQLHGKLDRETDEMLGDFGRYVMGHWHLPDQGIWEERGAPRPHTHSRVLCWVALDRLLALRRRGMVRRLDPDALTAHRAHIRADVVARGFDPQLASYTDALGGTDVDASLLLLAWYGFDAPSSLRMQHTFARVDDRLHAGSGLYHRNEESARRGEGAFGICSFWVADYLARAGRVERAREVFEGVVAHGNDVGLFGEEIEPGTGEALGNFPQAYTHVGLINAALSIAEASR